MIFVRGTFSQIWWLEKSYVLKTVIFGHFSSFYPLHRNRRFLGEKLWTKVKPVWVSNFMHKIKNIWRMVHVKIMDIRTNWPKNMANPRKDRMELGDQWDSLRKTHVYPWFSHEPLFRSFPFSALSYVPILARLCPKLFRRESSVTVRRVKWVKNAQK